MRLTAKYLEKMYDRFNKKYFYGDLKRPKIIVVRAGEAPPNPMDSERACQTEKFIAIREMDWFVDLRLVTLYLLHEMAHQNLGDEDTGDHRSKEWRAEMRRLSDLGAFVEVA